MYSDTGCRAGCSPGPGHRANSPPSSLPKGNGNLLRSRATRWWRWTRWRAWRSTPSCSGRVAKCRCRHRCFHPYANKTVSQVHGIVTVSIETAFVYLCVISMQANIRMVYISRHWLTHLPPHLQTRGLIILKGVMVKIQHGHMIAMRTWLRRETLWFRN